MNCRFAPSRFLAIAALCATAILCTSCATLQKFNSSPAAPLVFATTADAAVGVAVGKGVDPQVIANIASQLKKFDQGTTVTIPALQAELSSLEKKANFNVGEQAAVDTLVLAFSQVIQAQTQNGTIDTATQATIQLVLQDVITAAQLFGAQPPTADNQEQTTPGPVFADVAPPAEKHPLMSAVENPAAVGAAASTVLLAALQAFGHISFDGRTASGLTVLFTVGAAYLKL